MTSMKLVTAKWAIERMPFDELPQLMEWMAEKGFCRQGDDEGENLLRLAREAVLRLGEDGRKAVGMWIILGCHDDT